VPHQRFERTAEHLRIIATSLPPFVVLARGEAIGPEQLGEQVAQRLIGQPASA